MEWGAITSQQVAAYEVTLTCPPANAVTTVINTNTNFLMHGYQGVIPGSECVLKIVAIGANPALDATCTVVVGMLNLGAQDETGRQTD